MLLFEFPESSVQKFHVLTIVSFTHLLVHGLLFYVGADKAAL